MFLNVRNLFSAVTTGQRIYHNTNCINFPLLCQYSDLLVTPSKEWEAKDYAEAASRGKNNILLYCVQ